MTERTLEDLKNEFGAGTRVSSTTGDGKRGLLVHRDRFGGSILWDGSDTLLHYQKADFREETDMHPYIRRRLREIREDGERMVREDEAVAAAAVEAPLIKLDPFDTGSLQDLTDDV